MKTSYIKNDNLKRLITVFKKIFYAISAFCMSIWMFGIFVILYLDGLSGITNLFRSLNYFIYVPFYMALLKLSGN